MSDIYLSITETPTVVTLTNPLVSSAIAQSVTVTNVVSVNVVTMPAITVQAAAPAVTTVAGTVTASQFFTVVTSQTINFASTVTSSDAFNTGTDWDFILIQTDMISAGGTSTVYLDRYTTPTATGGASNFAIWDDTNKTSFTGGSANNLGASANQRITLIQSGPAAQYYYRLRTSALAGGVSGSARFYSIKAAYPYSSNNTAWNTGKIPVAGNVYVTNSAVPISISSITVGSLPALAAGTNQIGVVTARLQDGSGNNLTSTSIGGVQRLNVSLASAATSGGTPPSFINVYGGTDGSVARTVLLDSSGRTVVTGFPSTQPISGTVSVGQPIEIYSKTGNTGTALPGTENYWGFGGFAYVGRIQANDATPDVDVSAYPFGTKYLIEYGGVSGTNCKIQFGYGGGGLDQTLRDFYTGESFIDLIGNNNPNKIFWLDPSPDGHSLASLTPVRKITFVKTSGTANPLIRVWALTNPAYNPFRATTVTARLQDASGNNLTSTSIGGVQRLNVSLASAATPGGTLPSFVNVYGGADGSAVRTISVDSTGRQNTNVQLPRVTLIDGSGTVTTANTAITVFASSSTRSYLLVQVTTGSAFVNVGATATTVNGINLTAGQGYAWETTIPQGVVSLISTTTSSRYVAKEA